MLSEGLKKVISLEAILAEENQSESESEAMIAI